MADKKQLEKNAKEMRKHMTPQERKLWYELLSKRPEKFRRQVVLEPYVVDFCCTSRMLIIEIDGSQHYFEKGKAYDEKRDAYLKSLGYKILRYSNYDVNVHFASVCEDVYNHLMRG